MKQLIYPLELSLLAPSVRQSTAKLDDQLPLYTSALVQTE